MSPAVRRAALWVGLYLALAIAPLALALTLGREPDRPFLVELGVAFGFVGLALIGLQFVLTARFPGIASAYGTDTMLQFHRQAGLVAFGFVIGHAGLLLFADPAYLSFFDPRVNLPRAFALSAVLGALVLVVAVPFVRLFLKLPYEWWRLTHGLLALFILLVGTAHVLMVGHYVASPVARVAWPAMSAVAALLFVQVRLVRPWLLRRRPWRVEAVRDEGGGCHTLVLRADGHEGLRFEAGQFAWLTLGESPFSLQQHPFTIASSAETPDRIEMTIKALGDFTGAVGRVEPGTRAWLEGPFGAFTVDPDAEGILLVAGGIGITPMASILRTLRDRGDRRPVRLIHAAPTLEAAVLRAEIEALEPELDLEVTPVLEAPPEGWTGETGRVSRRLLEAALPPDPSARGRWQAFVCGPPPMMDAVERDLLELGLPRRRILSERFNIA
jgi:predicted ferric reductase